MSVVLSCVHVPDRGHIVKVRVGLKKIWHSSRSGQIAGLVCHGGLVTAV